MVGGTSSLREPLPKIQSGKFHTVTCFYDIKSKHSLANYSFWMRNFFQVEMFPITCFYGVPSDRDILLANGAARPNVRLVQVPIEHFCFSQIEIDWNLQTRLDPERSRHSVDLYKLWLEKSAFVCRATRLSPASFFLWKDIGQFRSRLSILAARRLDWVRIARVLESTKTVNYLSLNPIERDIAQRDIENMIAHYSANSFSAGANLWGSRDAWQPWLSELMELATISAQSGMFMGKDQILYSCLAEMRPDLATTHSVAHGRLHLTDRWFRLGSVLSQHKNKYVEECC